METKQEIPPVIRILLSIFFGFLPGFAFAFSVWISLAILTLILRSLLILH